MAKIKQVTTEDSIFNSLDSIYGNENLNLNIVKTNTDTGSSDLIELEPLADIGINNSGTSKIDASDYVFSDETPKTSNDSESMFSGKNIGGTLKGAGAIVGALSDIYGTIEQSKFNKEMLNMEKNRVARNNARQDQLQANYEGAWG